MNTFEVTGTIHAIMDTQQITDTFKKREFVVEVADGNYPQHVKFQLIQDKTALLDNFKVGQSVKVLFNLKGRPYQRKDGTTDYFLNLDCWRLEPLQSGSTQGGNTDYSQIQPAAVDSSKEEFDDVPF
ncbi:MAG: DUF3127 domain-containing protein [Bradyrhizobiaceae bacterium]|nr:DUF3127 domain-containing protein [Bradyrhizobiaceae bacterium]